MGFCGLAFTERSRRDGGDVDVLALSPRAHALQHLCDVDLGENPSIGLPLVVLKAKFRYQVLGGL